MAINPTVTVTEERPPQSHVRRSFYLETHGTKASLEMLSRQRMPTRKQEEFRFTDLTLITQLNVRPSVQATISDGSLLKETQLDDEGSRNQIVFLDGKVQWDLSNLNTEWVDVVGKAESVPQLDEKLGRQSSNRGGIFATLNGALFSQPLAIIIPHDVQIDSPLHLLYLSSGNEDGVAISAPRLYIRCEKGSKINLVEEYMPLDTSNSDHLSLPVCEIELHEESQLYHYYAQLDGDRSMHVKTTLVNQSTKSVYKLVESNIGGLLSRHDLDIKQDGDETETEMHHFQISGDAQLHDLHSKVTLDHEEGVVNQLHKCIVTASSGSVVFDGSVQVNQPAQRTDAGQLSRSLLLAPKATVNIKPNLQIVADDVKCTHGCTVSDLSDEEVFYFRARGIDIETARNALVFSFGSEINQRFESMRLKQRLEEAVLERLKTR